MSQSIHARIVNYRIGIREQMSKEILIQLINPLSTTLPGALIGKKVTWKAETHNLIGQIVGLHGKNGILRAKFKHGVPGQAIGSTVEVITS